MGNGITELEIFHNEVDADEHNTYLTYIHFYSKLISIYLPFHNCVYLSITKKFRVKGRTSFMSSLNLIFLRHSVFTLQMYKKLCKMCEKIMWQCVKIAFSRTSST